MWNSLNECINLDTGEILKISPMSYLIEDIQSNLPGEAFITFYVSEVEVITPRRFREIRINNVVTNYLFTKDTNLLEHNSSH